MLKLCNFKAGRLENAEDIFEEDIDEETPSSLTEQIAHPSTFEDEGNDAILGGPPRGKERKAEKSANIEKRMDEAFLFLKEVAAKPNAIKDESFLFCELLCY
ncbi:hypothetical protein HNY73_011236 [Argiope bruennichi]|uniref:Uncharacterized protein n=1 Tax=Argiope bruennichi TaxID=94029 RepID=A0A8T0F637_ARGBR|nr:hypothetical protein HNY73_011236 [Argiope bruennichi]